LRLTHVGDISLIIVLVHIIPRMWAVVPELSLDVARME
jgi:hypothetical protein